MQTVVLDAPGRLHLEERPRPRPGAGEVLVDVVASGICGTDISIYDGKIPVHHPLVLGHEMVGRIAELGEGAGGPAAGTRVVVDPALSCGRCYQCRKDQTHLCPNGALMGRDCDGGLQPALTVPPANVHALPDSVSDDVAALVQVAAVCMHGQRTIEIFPGDVVAVIGLGVTGLVHVQMAAARGARVIGITRSESKRRLALELGAELALDASAAHLASEVAEATHGVGPDVVVESAGTVETLVQAIELVRIGGRIMQYGTITATAGALPFYQLYYKELTITNPRAARPQDFVSSIALVARGDLRLEPIVSHRFPLHRTHDALGAARERDALKVVITHQEGAP